MIDTYEPLPVVASPRRISWGGIFAGVAVALALQLMLSTLGIGIGASALHPSNAASASGLGIGSVLWLFFTAMLALFAGGWVSGRLAAVRRPLDSALHGVIAWALLTILTLYLLTTAIGGIFSGAGAMLGNVLGAAGSGISAASPGLAKAAGSEITKTVTQGLAQPQARHVLAEAADAAKGTLEDPSASHDQFNALLFKVQHDTGTTSQSADREKLIDLVAAKEHESRAKATATVDEYQRDAASIGLRAKAAAQGALDDAKKVGDDAATGVATTGISTFFFLLLGALAAAFGGFLATPSALVRVAR